MEPMDNEILKVVMAEMIKDAQRKMANNLSEVLYASAPYSSFTPEQLEQFEKARIKRERKEMLLSPYYWIKCRIIGTWNVWTKGECGDCERDYY